jgi:hypothetical protein
VPASQLDAGYEERAIRVRCQRDAGSASRSRRAAAGTLNNAALQAR